MIIRLAIAITVWISACQTSRIQLTSTPSDAVVEIFNAETESYEQIGNTPFELSETSSKISSLILLSDLIAVRISKPGFNSEQVLIETSDRPEVKIHAKLSKGQGNVSNENQHELVNETAQTVNLVQKLIAEKRWEQAIVAVDGLLSSFPMAYYLWDMKGSIHLAQGAISEAKQAYRKSIELKPDNLDTKLMLRELEE